MDYRWRSADEQGRDLGLEAPGARERFDGQTEAEAWLSDNWEQLLAAGADQVTLLAGESEVYGPMSLYPAP